MSFRLIDLKFGRQLPFDAEAVSVDQRCNHLLLSSTEMMPGHLSQEFVTKAMILRTFRSADVLLRECVIGQLVQHMKRTFGQHISQLEGCAHISTENHMVQFDSLTHPVQVNTVSARNVPRIRASSFF